MRPEIVAIIERMLDALEATPGERVSLARSDVDRLVRWVRSGGMREIHAFAKGMQRAVEIIDHDVPARGGRDAGIYECCRRTCIGTMRSIGEHQRNWQRDTSAAYREARLREDDARYRRTKPPRAR